MSFYARGISKEERNMFYAYTIEGYVLLWASTQECFFLWTKTQKERNEA